MWEESQNRMTSTLSLRLSRPEQGSWETPLDVPLELGRQKTEPGTQRPMEPAPFCRHREEGAERVVVARLGETDFSRRQLRISPLDESKIRVENLSATRPLFLETLGEDLAPQQGVTVRLEEECRIVIDDLVIRIGPEGADDQQMSMRSLATMAEVPDLKVRADVSVRELVDLPQAQVDQLVRWISRTMTVLESAAYSGSFVEQTIKAICELLELDRAVFLSHHESGWQPVAEFRVEGSSEPAELSHRILDQVVRERRTSWQTPVLAGGSLVGVRAAVVSPVLDSTGALVGAVYGDRRSEQGIPLTDLHAQLFDMFTHCLAVGLVRQQREQEVLSVRRHAEEQKTRFSQFFSPQLAERLISEEDLLAAKDVDVSVLFCDIQGFSRVSERLGADATLEWIRATLGMLSHCILETGGVLVDYVGDEVMALWGAPASQPDHAQRACRAAQLMLARTDELNRRWQHKVGAGTSFCIGINSGPARVGNIGSDIKFKYGALGNTVNLGSRIQGVAKQLRTTVVVGESTREKLPGEARLRRLCSVQVVNIDHPVYLYELAEPADDSDHSSKTLAYERALSEFEASDFVAATKTLANLVNDFPSDGPARVLLMRAVEALTYGPEAEHPVWKLRSK